MSRPSHSVINSIRKYTYRIVPKTQSPQGLQGMALRRIVVAGNRTTLNKEMCHEEIHRRPRADLADRDPVADRDCERSPRVAVEPDVREQRLLTMSGQASVSSRGSRFGIRLAAGLPPRGGRPGAVINRDDAAILLAATPAVGLIHGAAECANERKRGQSKARRMKSRCPGMIT